MRIYSSKPTRLKRLDIAETALDSLRRGRDGYNHEISNDPRYLELTERFNDLTGTTVGRYCRELGDAEMPEAVLDVLRELIWIANGRNATFAGPVR